MGAGALTAPPPVEAVTRVERVPGSDLWYRATLRCGHAYLIPRRVGSDGAPGVVRLRLPPVSMGCPACGRHGGAP